MCSRNVLVSGVSCLQHSIDKVNSMVNYNLPLFENKPEVWDAKRCAKAAKHRAADGMGTKQNRKGYIGCTTSPYGYGIHRYNGGCIRNGEWYQGENNPLPIIDDAYEIFHVTTWGYYIRLKSPPATK